MEYLARVRAEIDLESLRHNYQAIRKAIGDSKYLAVVKSDAYGHGAAVVAPFLEGLGVDWFGVASLEEGMALRQAGIGAPILVFGWTDPVCAPMLAQWALTQTVYCPEYARRLSEEARSAGVTVEIHLKIDSGMGRLGYNVRQKEGMEALLAAAKDPAFRLSGIYTHFAVADEPQLPQSVAFTQQQFQLYRKACDFLQAQGIDVGIRHCCNSAAALLFPQMRLEMVRMGICTYGVLPTSDIQSIVPLQPVLSLRSTVAMVKTIYPGDTVSYGRRYTASDIRRIATIPVGYADGYLRALGGLAEVLIRGQRAPVIGRVCMDQLMVDVTQVPEVAMGDTVTLAGQDGSQCITMTELADLTGTISYERICALTQRVRRVYLGGESKNRIPV